MAFVPPIIQLNTGDCFPPIYDFLSFILVPNSRWNAKIFNENRFLKSAFAVVCEDVVKCLL